ncbi:iron regulated [Trifolium repens]|nr:iron regulated [Trifolium repens]
MISAIILALWNSVSVWVEYWLFTSVYNGIPANLSQSSQRRMERLSSESDLERNNSTSEVSLAKTLSLSAVLDDQQRKAIGATVASAKKAKRTLLMRHEAEIKSNSYWLGLLAHLQAASVPRKDISCIKDLTSLYEAATIEDTYLAYEQLKADEVSVYSCIGVAGAQTAQNIEGTLFSQNV